MDKNKERSANVELLRIVAMFLIVLSHFATHGRFIFVDNQITTNYLFVNLIKMGGKIGVNIFLLISGYFLVKSNFKLSKAIKLYLQILSYSVILSIIMLLCKKMTLSYENIINYLFPLSHGVWWFATTYFIMYLLVPYLNKLLNSLSKEEYKKLIITTTILFSIIPTIFVSAYVSNLTWFIALYCLGGYIQLHGLKIENMSSIRILLMSLTIVLVNFGGFVLIKIGLINNVLDEFSPTTFYDMYRIPILVISLLLFLYFKKIKVSHATLVNTIASTTFGIYLIHDYPLIRVLIWDIGFRNSQFTENAYLPLIAICETLIVFIVCSAIELIRRKTIEPIYMNIIEKKYPNNMQTKQAS